MFGRDAWLIYSSRAIVVSALRQVPFGQGG